jgi:two-component system, response regulator PdtaR
MNNRLVDKEPRILVVEDEAIVGCELAARLEAYGYEVAGVATSAEQALSSAAETSPNLVLIDIHLNGPVDGIEVAERIHADLGAAVIFLTAHADEDTLRRAKLVEPFAYLLKPYNERELKISIDVAFYKRQAERDREKLTRQLEKALAEVRTLRGLIPICAWCGKLRGDNGFWMSVEAYLRSHTDAACTHSICPTCYEKQLASDEPVEREQPQDPARPASHSRR